MRRLAFAIPGDLALPTGGYGYDRRLIAGLAGLGWEVEHVALPAGYPEPDEAARAATRERLARIAPGVPVMVDGLAFGVMAEEAAVLSRLRPLVALVHHPLAHETGLPATRAARLRASETAALAHAAAVVVTSPATAAALAADFAVPPGRITVAVPGTDRAAPARGSGGPGVRLLSVGSLLPRKGHGDLVAALAGLAALDWSLDIVGDDTLDPAHAAQLRAGVAARGLGARIRLHGALPRAALETFYDGADLFVLASHYEGYGMAYAEALAHGLPVVGTTGGAVAQTVGEGGTLVAPGDVAALAGVLRRLIADAPFRAERAAAARRAGAALPDWDQTAARVAATLGSLS